MQYRSKLIVAGLLVFVAAAGIFYSVQRNGHVLSDMQSITPSGTGSIPRVAPAGQKLYHDLDFYFSFFYPKELSVSKTYNGTGTTLVFQSINPAEGFQIYIIPYHESTVTPQRFAMDEPSGVRKNVTTGLIDGAQAAAFYSTSASLGGTYEIWFIHNGFLYEVTTLAPLDTWLQSIMKTWRFDA